MLAVLCALGSSLLYALASVLQHRGASDQPDEESLKVSLLLRLVRQPIWVLGLVCDAAGYVLQFVALGHGAIVVVQPLLVCGLLFALPLGAAWSGRRLSRIDWVGAVLVCAGLAVFLGVAAPAPGRNNTGPVQWATLLIAAGVVAVALTLTGRRADRRGTAVALAAAAGVVYGAAAALTKTSSHLLDRGIVPVVIHWQPYVLVVFGVAGMVLAQSAFQAGALDFSLPTMTVVDPIVSIAIGAFVFHEAVAAKPIDIMLEVLALAAMSAGVWFLARHEAALPERGHVEAQG
ncbi:MAG: DMT family transporter [Acidobacteriota bacterium]|nr:DMT family transporter [Acidobacteriota bacterium]